VPRVLRGVFECVLALIGLAGCCLLQLQLMHIHAAFAPLSTAFPFAVTHSASNEKSLVPSFLATFACVCTE